MTGHLQDLPVEIGLQAESKFELSSSSDSEQFTKPRLFAAGPTSHAPGGMIIDQVLLLELSVQLEGHRRNGKCDRDLFLRSDRRTSILVVVPVFSSLLATGRDDGGGGYHSETRHLKPSNSDKSNNAGLCHM